MNQCDSVSEPMRQLLQAGADEFGKIQARANLYAAWCIATRKANDAIAERDAACFRLEDHDRAYMEKP